jgi:putative membrane protein
MADYAEGNCDLSARGMKSARKRAGIVSAGCRSGASSIHEDHRSTFEMSQPDQVKLSSLIASLVMVVMSGAYAQTPTSGATTGTKSAPSAMSNSTAPAAMGNTSSNADLARGDRSFMMKAAQGGIAEVELGQIAAQKATDPQVKEFAQRMVDDHSKANDKLKQVASSKNVVLPNDLPSDAKREADKLSKLSGTQFDKEYMKDMLSDHKKDVSLFRSTAKSAKDSDVKQFASETLPTIEQHLQMAQSIGKSK